MYSAKYMYTGQHHAECRLYSIVQCRVQTVQYRAKYVQHSAEYKQYSTGQSTYSTVQSTNSTIQQEAKILLVLYYYELHVGRCHCPHWV